MDNWHGIEPEGQGRLQARVVVESVEANALDTPQRYLTAPSRLRNAMELV